MSGKFQLDEVLIFQKGAHEPELNERECEVRSIMTAFLVTHPDTMEQTREDGYGVRFADGTKRFAFEYQLRRKTPPEAPASWEQIERLSGFNPSKVIVPVA